VKHALLITSMADSKERVAISQAPWAFDDAQASLVVIAVKPLGSCKFSMGGYLGFIFEHILP